MISKYDQSLDSEALCKTQNLGCDLYQLCDFYKWSYNEFFFPQGQQERCLKRLITLSGLEIGMYSTK